MFSHRNLTRNAKGGECVIDRADIRCPHCADCGIVSVDGPGNASMPCPGCSYGELLDRHWQGGSPWQAITVVERESLSWENGITLRHTAVCSEPANSRHYPNGVRCRKPAIPSPGLRTAMCDWHALDADERAQRLADIAASSSVAARFVADARASWERWDAEAAARAVRDDLPEVARRRALGGAA